MSDKVKKTSVRSICFTAIMAALVFVFTFTFKIPIAVGYVHLGDVIIFLSVILLGTKRSCLAGAIGGALADLLGGYTMFVAPTFVIKLCMALICGVFVEKIIKNSIWGYVIGAVLGGAFQVVGYTLVSVLLYDKASAVAAVPENIIQSAVGIIGALVIILIFNKTKVTDKLKKLAQ